MKDIRAIQKFIIEDNFRLGVEILKVLPIRYEEKRKIAKNKLKERNEQLEAINKYSYEI